MKKISFIILFAVLGVTLASCTKETLSDTRVVTVEPSVTYFVNGQMHSSNPQTEEEWLMFFDRMLALAQEGYQVRIRRSDIPQEDLPPVHSNSQCMINCDADIKTVSGPQEPQPLDSPLQKFYSNMLDLNWDAKSSSTTTVTVTNVCSY